MFGRGRVYCDRVSISPCMFRHIVPNLGTPWPNAIFPSLKHRFAVLFCFYIIPFTLHRCFLSTFIAVCLHMPLNPAMIFMLLLFACIARAVACEQTALSFGQQLRTTAILAAETDLSRLVVPSLARALSAGSRKERPSNGGYFRAECSQTQKASRRTFREAHFQSLKRLPQNSDECHGANEDVVLWAPVLAVCRSVDAVVSGTGRPRMNFVRRRSNGCLAGAT